MKEEEVSAPAIADPRGRLLYYLEHGGDASSWHTRTAPTRQHPRRSAGCDATFGFVTSNVVLKWVRANPDLTLAWAEDRGIPWLE